MSRVRTRTHGSVGRRGRKAPSDPIAPKTTLSECNLKLNHAEMYLVTGNFQPRLKIDKS